MTECQDEDNDGDERHESVTDTDLNEGKHIHCLVTPVDRVIQSLLEVRLPDGEHPVVANYEPHEEK